MANFTISPNMNLVIPTPGEDQGPDYASNNSNSFMIVDSHNHSPGYGVPVSPNGMNINADLPMNSNNLTLVKTVNFTSLSGTLPGISPNLGALYVAGNELVYNDENGNVVPITNNGSVNAGAGSITGLPSGTASASYSSGSQTFVWQSATSTPANMDFAAAIFRNLTANSKGLTVSPPTAMAADYALVWPTLPASTLLVTLDTSGNFGTISNQSIADTLGQAMTSVGANAILDTQTRTGFTTEWQSYTPTITGFTIASQAFSWRKVGQNVEVMGQVNPTGTNGSIITISLPGSFVVSTDVPQAASAINQVVGNWIRDTAAQPILYVLASPVTVPTSVVRVGIADSTNNPRIPITGTSHGTLNFACTFSVPVS